MRNSLEQFVKQHRDAFDSEEPAPHIGENVLKNKESRSFTYRSIWQWASVAAIFIIAAILSIFLMKDTKENTRLATNNDPDMEIEIVKSIDPEKAKEVEQFSEVIEQKQSQLKQIKNEHPQLYNEFAKSVENLDSIYHALEEELKTTPNKEVLLEAMIQNLRLQTGLLSKQLEIIQKLKQKNNQNESKTI